MRLFLDEQSGGNTKFSGVVEIDESAFAGKRKHNRGKVRKTQWVFGIVDRNSKRQKFFHVPDRKRQTLLNIIMDNVEVGSTIMSDGYHAYRALGSKGYEHKWVNHSEEFVNSFNRDVHTQKIEGSWKWVKEFCKDDGPAKRKHLQERLDEWTFRKTYMFNKSTNMHILARLVGKYGVAAKKYIEKTGWVEGMKTLPRPYYRSDQCQPACGRHNY